MKIDFAISFWIKNHFPTETLRRILGRWNRGEVFLIILLPILYSAHGFRPFWLAFSYIVIIAFINDRLVLFLKKIVSRGRPLISIAGKLDSNPDMKHSFPSAHSANSMVVVIVLILAFQVSSWIFIFTILAGIGRLLSLHHFLSDLVGGWIVGLIVGLIAVGFWKFLIAQDFFIKSFLL
ncbi:MAG: phosphatase PAP2 family protein [Leptospira sp.]|nr:MAG: phosphatase PAP2 family protein [Leptospira sp.]